MQGPCKPPLLVSSSARAEPSRGIFHACCCCCRALTVDSCFPLSKTGKRPVQYSLQRESFLVFLAFLFSAALDVTVCVLTLPFFPFFPFFLLFLPSCCSSGCINLYKDISTHTHAHTHTQTQTSTRTFSLYFYFHGYKRCHKVLYTQISESEPGSQEALSKL